MEKLKTKRDTESKREGRRAETVSSSRPSLLWIKGKEKDGGMEGVTSLRSRGFNCARIPLPLHKCHVCF